ncbi:MAG: hypothetical protein NVS1B14_00760 [Vulcanimicrobiaceae bacterium]
MDNIREVALQSAVPAAISDPLNASILAISEDRLSGFQVDPFGEVARRSGLPLQTVLERVRAMLEAGTIRRVRQTLMATNLAPGALVAWQIAGEQLDGAFDYLFREDPFSGHVVIRTTDTATPGSNYRLWTTLKVPQGFSLPKHAEFLRAKIGAERFRLMPAKKLFALGVGHVRRRGMPPGSRADEPAEVKDTEFFSLYAMEWRFLEPLTRDFTPAEIVPQLWYARARDARVDLGHFYAVAQSLDKRRVIGRFSTFLEHVKVTANNERVTRYNALFHWAVPSGCEIAAGQEVGRHHIMTHA